MYTRTCHLCNGIINYKNIGSFKRAEKLNKQCKRCANISRIRTPEWNAKISLARKGKKHSVETRKLISEVQKQQYELGKKVIWNKGLTKHTSDSIKRSAEKLSARNLGKTYESIHGPAKAALIKQKQRVAKLGFKHSNETRKLMSEIQQLAQSGKRLTETHKENIRRSMYNKLCANTYTSYEEWKESFSEREKYYKRVRSLTESQPLYKLKNYDKRGKTGYHLDHIIPVSYGYANNIPPEAIADISNLQMLPYDENIKKGNKYV
jgi:hypothetical protein